jgi:hypothetical protein
MRFKYSEIIQAPQAAILINDEAAKEEIRRRQQ